MDSSFLMSLILSLILWLIAFAGSIRKYKKAPPENKGKCKRLMIVTGIIGFILGIPAVTVGIFLIALGTGIVSM